MKVMKMDEEMKMSEEMNMDEEMIVETLPDKSRSLRRTSVKKRLETEIKKTNIKVKKKMSTLSK